MRVDQSVRCLPVLGDEVPGLVVHLVQHVSHIGYPLGYSSVDLSGPHIIPEPSYLPVHWLQQVVQQGGLVSVQVLHLQVALVLQQILGPASPFFL